MSQLASSILGTLNTIGRGQTPQARVAAAQQNEVNQQAIIKQRSQNLLGEIDISGNYVTYDTTGDGQIAQIDVPRLMKERPDLVLASLNMDPAYNQATDENGTNIQTEVSDIVVNEDGSYSAIVTRPDGRKAPLTQNRTAEGDDVVVKLDPNEFNQVVTNTYLRGITRGGKENAGSFLREQGQVNKVLLQETILDQAADKLAADNSAMANFYRIVNLSDEEGLRGIAADFGVDITGLETQKADDERAAELKARDDLPTINPAQRSKLETLRTQLAAEEAKLGTRGGNAAARNVGRIKGEISRTEKELIKNHPDYVALQNEARSLRGVNTKEARARKSEIENKLLRETKERILESAKSMDTVMAELKTGDTVPLTAAELRAEIEKGTVEVTPDKMANMRRYLNENGITTVEDMRKLPSAKQLEVALIASVGQGKTNQERAEAFQKQLNFLQRGAMDYTRGQQIDDEQTGVTTQLQAANLQRNRLNDQRNLQKDANTAVKESTKLSQSIIGKVLTDDNRFTFDDEILGPGVKAEVSKEMNRLVNMAAGIQGVERAAYQRAVINALIPYVAAEAEEQQGSVLNPLNWPDKVMDLIARDSNYFQVGNMEDRIKVNTEVVNGKTLAKSITFLDNQGAPTDITVDLDDLQLNQNLKRVLIGIPSRANRQ
jgi:hypothetical protein